MDSAVTSIDFDALFGRPRGLPGILFSDLARPEVAAEEKNMKNVVLEAPRIHVSVLFGTRPVPKGLSVMKAN